MIEAHPRAVVQIAVDGASLDDIARRRLINLTHTDNRGFEADTVELELDDSDGALDLPPRGAILTLALGWAAEGLVDKGSYTVDEVTHQGAPDTLTIRARSADLRAGLTTQRDRSWHDTTLGAIVQTIATENGLKAQIAAGLAGEAIEHVDQTNETSANLLTRLALMFDAIATVKNGGLIFIPMAGAVTAGGNPIPSISIVRQSGDRHNFSLADRRTWSAVRALYHDLNKALKGEVIWGDTDDSTARQTQPAAAKSPEVGQYKPLAPTYTSRAKAQRAAQAAWKTLKANKAQRAAYIGVRAKYNDKNLNASGEVTYGGADDDAKSRAASRAAQNDAAKLAGTIGNDNAFSHSAENIKTLRHVYANHANAQRAAQAEWRRLQRGMAQFSIALAHGIPDLYPETPVTVSGFKRQIDSTDWIVVKVVNTVTGDGGYGQTIELEIKAAEIPD